MGATGDPQHATRRQHGGAAVRSTMPVEMLVRVTDVQQAERLPRAVVLARLRERLGDEPVQNRESGRRVEIGLHGPGALGQRRS